MAGAQEARDDDHADDDNNLGSVSLLVSPPGEIDGC